MTFTKYSGIVSVVAMSLMVPATASSAALVQPADVRVGDFKSTADALLAAAYPADGPGAAVIVTRGGRVIYSKGRGLANVEARRPITADTGFRLGSIVKQFTAAVVLKLVDEKKISLDDPISRFFPDYPQPSAAATVRQLLNHTSGIQDFSKIPGWIVNNRHRPWTTAELLAVSRDLPARAQPGHAWEYNNGGYVLLGAIIEKVTGQAWHEALSERVTRPLHLRSIAYAVPSDITPEAARGYTERNGRQQPVQLSHMSVAHAAGGLQGSVNDMARWARALHHGRVVSPALYQEMIRPARLADGSTEPYGFGLRLREIRGRAALVHGGAGGGLDTDSAYIPSEDLFVAVFANSDDPATDPSTLVSRLAALALGEPIPSFSRVDIDRNAVAPLFGVYSAERGPPRRFFARDGKYHIARGDDERELIPAGDDRFFLGSEGLVWLRFARRADGSHLLEVHSPEASKPELAVRTGPIPADAEVTVAPAILQSYVGTYPTDAGPTATVAMGDNGWLTIQLNGPPLPMRPVSQTEYMVDRARSRVVFHPENGQVNRLTIHRGARVLTGRRVPDTRP